MNHLPVISAIVVLSMMPRFSLADESSPKPIRVGILHSQTGRMAISEQSLVDAITMAIDEINERGGVLGRPLVAIIEDGESDWPTFAEKAEELIVEDRVVSVFGCWTSASRKAVLPVLEEYDNLLWYPVQYEGLEDSKHVIYTGATPNQQILPAVDWCRREFGTRMFLVGSDYVFPRTANKIIKLRLKGFGASPIGEEYRPLASDDFDGIAEKIKESEPDVVLNTVNGASNRAFFQSLRDAGIGPRDIPVMSFSLAEDELRSIGLDLAAGHYCSWNYFQSIDTPANRRFVNHFKERYGSDRVTDDPIEAAYFQVHLFASAVRAAGSTDVEAIRRAARGLIHAAPGGLIRVDPRNQHTWKVSRVGRIQADGQFKIVWSSGDPLRPRPYLPEIFISTASEHGQKMFANISEMIDLESVETGGRERKQLLASMADVRGYLGDARTKFRSAAMLTEPQRRSDFDQAWNEFQRRWHTLREKREQLTEPQRESLDRFSESRDIYEHNARSMFEARYEIDEEPDGLDSEQEVFR